MAKESIRAGKRLVTCRQVEGSAIAYFSDQRKLEEEIQRLNSAKSVVGVSTHSSAESDEKIKALNSEVEQLKYRKG